MGSGATGPIGSVRARLRAAFYRFLRHVAAIDDTRQIFSGLLAEQGVSCTVPELARYDERDSPYPELRRSPEPTPEARDDVVFITARFRTGSTLLWNLFRNLPGATAYYEPFNERRWFDPSTRGSRTDATHLRIDNYWAEYDGLETLDRWYSVDWRFKQLYMAAHAYEPGMERYIQALIDHAPARPVLQFNAVDLRLPWLRAHFPRARLVHLYRNPRDQWCSTLGSAPVRMRELTQRDFQPRDGFYLLSWGRDLRHYFPFLQLDPDAHPYELFYQIWKLSYLFGSIHADLSFSFEELTQKPEQVIRWLLDALSFEEADASALASLVSPVETGKWKHHECDDLYDRIESTVDRTLARYRDTLSLSLACSAPGPRAAQLGESRSNDFGLRNVQKAL